MVHHQNQNGFTWKRTKETPCITVRYKFVTTKGFKVSEDAENMSARSIAGSITSMKNQILAVSKILYRCPVNKLPLTDMPLTDKQTCTDDCTSSQTARAFPAFSVFGQIGQEFTQWLTGSGGGCKKERAAQQIVKRSFKFLKFCCEDEEELRWEIVDFSLCSPSLLFKFVDHLQDKCMLGHGGRLGYIDAISELIDFRKISGASNTVLRHLTTTELYLKGARKTVAKMMRWQWTQDLDIETLEARGHWATMEEMLEVVTYHLPRYENIVKTCKTSPGQVNPSDLTFAMKFVAIYLFIKVKGSRPMTYQYLTVDMVSAAKENRGFIDQKMFKTARRYGFDSLILTDASMQVLDGYINFVLVTRNGGQHSKLGDVMSKQVFDAIGKYIHPTRYRQIVETQSLNQLNSTEQRILSEDQKHSSAVARVHYQKQRSREVATKGHKCLQKLQGAKGFELDEEIYSRFGSNCSDSERQDESLTKRGKETVDEQAPRASNTMSSEQPCIKHVHRRVLKIHARRRPIFEARDQKARNWTVDCYFERS